MYDESFIDWFADHIDSGYTGTQLDELSDIEFHSDAEARLGYKQLTGGEPQPYKLNISEPKFSNRFVAIKGPQAVGDGKWSDRAISKAYKDPRLNKFWRKIDGKYAGDEYLMLIKKVLRLEAWLGYRERHYDEEYLWNLSTYHQSLTALTRARREIDELVKNYDLPPIDIDMLIEETQ
mgnify:CR=1 FL=1